MSFLLQILSIVLIITYVHSDIIEDLNKRRNTEYSSWKESNGPINDPDAVNIGELRTNYPIVCRIATSEALIPGTLEASTGLCQTTWNGEVISSMSTEYLSGPLTRLVWEDSNRGNVPTGAIVGGITSEGTKIYIIRIEQESTTKLYFGGKLIKGEKQGTIIKDGKEAPAPTYKVLCLETIIFP